MEIFQARELEWIAVSFSRGLPDSGIEHGSPALLADTLPSEPPGVWKRMVHTKGMIWKKKKGRNSFSEIREYSVDQSQLKRKIFVQVRVEGPWKKRQVSVRKFPTCPQRWGHPLPNGKEPSSPGVYFLRFILCYLIFILIKFT